MSCTLPTRVRALAPTLSRFAREGAPWRDHVATGSLSPHSGERAGVRGSKDVLETRCARRHLTHMPLDYPHAEPPTGPELAPPPPDLDLLDAYSQAVSSAVAKVAPAVAHVRVEHAKAARGRE